MVSVVHVPFSIISFQVSLRLSAVFHGVVASHEYGLCNKPLFFIAWWLKKGRSFLGFCFDMHLFLLLFSFTEK